MVTAVSPPINPKTRSTARTTQNLNPARPPLLPSDPDNALAPRRPKSREVSSRYLSSASASASASSTSTFNRCASPSISRRTAMMTPTPSAASAIKRSQSLERRRPATPRTNSLDSRIGNASCGGGGGGEITNAQRMLITSTRRLSVSFQGESFSFQVSKAKPTSSPSAVRKGTPERRKATTPIPTRGADQAENSRTMEQRRWPGRLRQQNSMTRSMDCSDDGQKSAGSGVNLNVVRALQNSMVGGSSNNNNNIIRSSIESRLSSDSSAIESAKPLDVNGSAVHSEHRLASDTESASSGTTSESSSGNAVGVGGQGERGARGLIVPARFWKETNNRIRRQPEPGSPGSRNAGLKGPTPAKLVAPKKFGSDSPVSSPKGVVNSRGQLSPIRGGALRPASPSKFGTLSGASSSPMRGISPSRVRNAVGGVVSSNLSNVSTTFSILSFAADIRRGRIGENRIVEVHLLRILHNRMLQWRFVNARADYALSAQRLNVEMLYLEELALIDQDYSHSLSGAIEALQASTLRLPVVGGARADVQNLKDAICSAVDVMQAMASSICTLLSKVEEVNSLVVELEKASRKECNRLYQCKDLLSTIAALQVKECSLKSHILQLK
ncbi:QWRF motif-containing protein 2-like isoform X2 [Populus alba x Populus x berolinensis]|uniref:QWRF motif-containing protein 2-like isoform X2 n=1 Tax=Populus alba x Populus x berolinensis TaxID=444605 RepID=A0AAD6PXW0_9ROSI|nr:QWRF motif-containing protein 2-like isoform X2 [Populus alba x Populus x berolinensis]